MRVPDVLFKSNYYYFEIAYLSINDDIFSFCLFKYYSIQKLGTYIKMQILCNIYIFKLNRRTSCACLQKQ